MAMFACLLWMVWKFVANETYMTIVIRDQLQIKVSLLSFLISYFDKYHSTSGVNIICNLGFYWSNHCLHFNGPNLKFWNNVESNATVVIYTVLKFVYLVKIKWYFSAVSTWPHCTSTIIIYSLNTYMILESYQSLSILFNDS